jgi:hypothetical protein
MAGLYLFLDNLPGKSQIIYVYSIHTVLNTFGLILLAGILSQYRYSVLVFYSSLVSFIATGIIVLLISTEFSTSSSALFIFTGLASMSFFISSFVGFGIQWVYYQVYVSSGLDPLGDLFHHIEREERSFERAAEDLLLKK